MGVLQCVNVPSSFASVLQSGIPAVAKLAYQIQILIIFNEYRKRLFLWSLANDK
jgi:hypothetical protein